MGKTFSAFSRDGDLLLTWSPRGEATPTIRLWDVTTGRLLSRRQFVPDESGRVAISDETGHLVVGERGYVSVRAFGYEMRKPAELAKLVACHVPWKVEGDMLAPVLLEQTCVK